MYSTSKLRTLIFCLFCLTIFFLLFLPYRSSASEITLLAAGDVTLTNRIDDKRDMEFFSDGVKNLIRRSDAFFWNCEFTGLSSSAKGNTYIFRATGKNLDKFTFPNSVGSTSNNHVFDGREEGARNLMKYLSAAGTNHNGLHLKGKYTPFKMSLRDGKKLYFLSGGPMSQSGSGPNVVTLTYDGILSHAAKLRRDDPNAIIVTYFHDGTERQTAPTARQKDIASRCAAIGVDFVLFSHSHVYGGFQVLNNSPKKTFVAWGLGNFIFGGNGQWQNNNDVRMLQIKMNTKTLEKSASWLKGYTSGWKFSLHPTSGK